MPRLADPSSMHAQAAQARQTLSLRQLIAMGQAQKPWSFVPIAREALPQTGHDPELWHALISNLADLGLRSLALLEFDAFCEKRPGAAKTPIVRALGERLQSLPDDRLDPELCTRRVESVVGRLHSRGINLKPAFERWKERNAHTSWYQAEDGNVVRLKGGEVQLLSDQRGSARAFAEQHLAQINASPAPVTIEGMDPPWLFVELAERTPMNDAGYQVGIRIIQSDADEFLDACALADLSVHLGHERVDLFIGSDAPDELSRSLDNQAGRALTGAYIPLGTLRTRAQPGLPVIFERTLRAHTERHRQNLRRIQARDAERDEGYWRRRIARAIEGGAEPLRIFITASRFTTVLHSMCEDLAHALRDRGCEVLLLTEPGPHRKLAPLAYSDALATFDPDIILAPNHTRPDLERVITGSEHPPSDERVLPASAPFVVWVQDAMPHLLSAKAGASIGALDLAVGYISRTMIEQLAYPAEAVLPAQLVASERRFRRVEMPSDDYACDIAMMTHHSETPNALWERLQDELSASPALCRALGDLRPELDTIAPTTNESPGTYHAVRALIDRVGVGPEEREVLVQNVGMRYVDRVLRHEAANWASNICARRGWKFRIFGKGWEDHPALAQYASGALPHNDALALAYARAGVTLHVSAFNALHQRIFECALAGGCPIIRRTHDSDTSIIHMLRRRIHRDLEPDVIDDPGDGEGPILWFDPMRSLDTARLARYLQERGKKIPVRLPMRERLMSDRVEGATTQCEADPLWIMGDARETSFSSESDLERIILRAREVPTWRNAISAGVAKRVRSHFTHAALAERLLAAMKDRVSQSRETPESTGEDPLYAA